MKANAIRLTLFFLAAAFIAACKSPVDVTANANADTTAPTVTLTVAADKATGVSINADVVAVFSEEMTADTVNAATFVLKQGTTAVAGSVTYAGNAAVFKPVSAFAINTLFTATITTGVKDLAGNSMAADMTWSFTTGATPDSTPPTVSTTLPADSATGVVGTSALTVTFSEAMDPTTIKASTFTLMQGTTAVAGSISYMCTGTTFQPTAVLASGATYTATITTGATDLAGNALASNKTWTFTIADTIPPTVVSTSPASGATNVAVNAAVTATFSEPMAPATITGTTFTLKQGTTPVAGAVTYAGVTGTFTPTSAFASNTVYTAAITTGVTDLAGNAMVAIKTWTFTSQDTIPPTVTSTSPVSNATGVAINVHIAATFSEALAPATINATTTTFILKQGTTPIAGTVSYTGVVATFAPSAALAYNTVYTATITTGVTDLAGNAMTSPYSWSFTTAAIIPPTVSSTSPASGAINVAINAPITATFSTAMNATTITNSTFTLAQGANSVAGQVNGATGTFTPTASLAYNTLYTATITTGVTDSAGHALASPYTWTFTTVVAVGGLQAVDLGSAGTYVILSKSGIMNTAPSVINGNIGVSPIDYGAITGFDLVPTVPDGVAQFATSSQVIGGGHVYAPGYVPPTPANLTQAITDMEAAYTSASAAQPSTITDLLAGSIGVHTFAPGAYKWNSGVAISGDITLSGSSSDVWIFQISGVLSLGAGITVHLTGSAVAKNVFWQTTASTLLASSHMEGIILSSTTIALGANASVNGRLYAQTAVTLITNTVTQPAP